MDHILYERREPIGSGGYADVYKALHLPTNRIVALKLARQDPDIAARVRREIDIQRQLHHANILPVLDFDQDDFSWFVTDLAHGNLGELDEKERLSPWEVVRLAEEMLGALGVAHRRGFVHRDLSPPNILRMRRHWVLGDWGLVSDPNAGDVGRLTNTGSGAGTLTWAAPELLLKAHSVDNTVDLFALGKILAWLLTKEVPEIGVAPPLPEGRWKTFLARLTDEDPAERFSSAEEALLELAPVIGAVRAEFGPQSSSRAPLVAVAPEESRAATTIAFKVHLVDPGHRIRLDELVDRTVKEVVRELGTARFDPDRYDSGPALVERLLHYAEACRPVMDLLFLGCRYGDPTQAALWTRTVQQVVNAARTTSGKTRMLELQSFPGALLMGAGALGAVLGDRLENIVPIAVTPRAERSSGGSDPLVAWGTASTVANRDVFKGAPHYENKFTPGSEILADALRPLGTVGVVADGDFEEAFDRAELLLAMLAFANGGASYGCYSTRGRTRFNDDLGYGPLARAHSELDQLGADWGPLRAGLFGGDLKRAGSVFERVVDASNQIRRS